MLYILFWTLMFLRDTEKQTLHDLHIYFITDDLCLIWSHSFSMTTFFNISQSSDLFMINYFNLHWYGRVHFTFISWSVFPLNIEFLVEVCLCCFLPALEAQGLRKVNYHCFVDMKTEDAKTVNRSQKLWLQASCSLTRLIWLNCHLPLATYTLYFFNEKSSCLKRVYHLHLLA